MSVTVHLPSGRSNKVTAKTEDTGLYYMATVQWPTGVVTLLKTDGDPPGVGSGPDDMIIAAGPESQAGGGDAEIQLYYSESGDPGSYEAAWQGVYQWGSTPLPVVGANDVQQEPYDKGVIRMV